jgi:hypothetical protein
MVAVKEMAWLNPAGLTEVVSTVELAVNWNGETVFDSTPTKLLVQLPDEEHWLTTAKSGWALPLK